jgi:hypothetical protein
MYHKFDVTRNLLFAQCFFFEELNTSYIAFSSSFSAPHQDRGWAWFISPVPATYATVELPAEAFGEFQGGPRAGQKRCWHRRRRKPQRVMTQGGHAHTTAALRQGDSGAMGHGAATRAPTHQRLGERGAAGQGAAARIPDHQRLGARVPPRRRRHISPPDSEGWREMLPQQADTPATADITKSRRPCQRGIPEPLRGRCLNCLSFTHRIATCRLPRRCFCCRGFRHLGRDCKCSRSLADSAWRRSVRASRAPGKPRHAAGLAGERHNSSLSAFGHRAYDDNGGSNHHGTFGGEIDNSSCGP